MNLKNYTREQLENLVKEMSNNNLINSSEMAAEMVLKIKSNKDFSIFQENFILMILNNQNKLIDIKVLFKGGLTATSVDVKILFREFFKYNTATAIIIAHNHPSGKVTPSENDKQITNKIKKGCEILNINILDHIIFSEINGEYYSFNTEGIL